MTRSTEGPEEVRHRAESAFGETHLIALAAGVWIAVMWAPSMPSASVIVGCAVVGAFLLRPGLARLGLVALAVILIACSRGAAAEAGFRLAEPRTLDAVSATMVTDPEPRTFGWRAEAKLDGTGQRVRLAGAGFGTPDAVAGQPVLLTGRLGPAEDSDWNRSRHVVGVVSGAEVRSSGSLAWFRQPSEWLRAGVLGATASFGDDHAALYHGLVIGDDRFQSQGQQAQFRVAGLSHLLAVSGQNVAFLLAVVAPITSRLRPAMAASLIAILLLVFALATRLEPSVLRATVTAGVSTLATLRSARSAGVRSLALAVIVLLLVDPFLARSVGFRLSVGASSGILLLAPLIRARLRGPAWIAAPVSITLAAQCGVSPILLAVFGPVATVSIPANLLAGWAAGAVMTLGLSVGLAASLAPRPVATLLQLPARSLVWWIDRVAAEAAVAPLPSVTLAALPWLGLALVAIWGLRPARLWVAWWLVPLAAAVWLSSSGQPELEGFYQRSGERGSVLVLDDPNRRWVDEIVAARIREIDVVVAADGGWATARALDRLRDVADIGAVFAPGDHRIVGGRRVLEDTHLVVVGGRLELSPASGRIEVEFVARSGDR